MYLRVPWVQIPPAPPLLVITPHTPLMNDPSPPRSVEADAPYWIALHRIHGMGRVRFNALIAGFDSMEEAWSAPASALRRAGLDSKVVSAVVEARPSMDPRAEADRLEGAGVRALTLRDEAYPARLRETYDPPPVLYVRGTLTEADERSITVVGTRDMTSYGREVTRMVTEELARNGMTIVSGLARGVDAAAHKAALDAQGRTLAVLACGLDMVYPTSHRALAERITENGALISDYPLGTKPKPEYFPRRNRILAGLTLGTIVTEAPERSGALITTTYALNENREVFAVPGSVLSPASAGTNRLVQEGGAKLVRNAADVLEELNLTVPARQLPLPSVEPADETEAALLALVSREPTHIDAIREESGLPMPVVSGTLALMELKGLVKEIGPMSYISQIGGPTQTGRPAAPRPG